MPISDAEKKVLLERLEKARIAKQLKAEQSRAGKVSKKSAPEPEPTPEPVTSPPVIIPAPTPAPAPAPEERPPPSTPIDIPTPPDLVAASRKKQKKVEIHESDSDSDIALPPKKKKPASSVKKETPFLKLKLYKEPQDKAAFQNLLQAVAGEHDDDDDDDEEEEEETHLPPPPPQKKQYSIGPRVVKHVGATPRGGPASRAITKEEIEANELRKLALQIFG